MSRLVTNAIRSTAASSDAITIDSAGKPSFPNGGVGKILQVKQTVKLDTFTTTSTSDVDVTGLSVAITPSSSSNKILVTVSIALGQESANFTYAILKRGSTQIGEADGANNRLRPTLMQYDGNEGVVRLSLIHI